ncbi:MAG TPA: methyl-accepting chemotaxis protein, partial [Phenylobacterium sp.]|nr:methyl-accepting chemotaxis protein [Phenylobacterium sp.]
EIKTLISASSQQANSGVQLVGQTGEDLQRIVDRVAEIDGMVGEIAATAQEQSVGLAQVNTAVNQMDQVTQQNAAMVEETTAAASSLKGEAGELTRLIAGFHTGAPAAAPTAAQRRRAAGVLPTPRLREDLLRGVDCRAGKAVIWRHKRRGERARRDA